MWGAWKVKDMTTDEMQDLYAKVFNYMADKYKEKLSLLPDYQAGHMEHLYIVSYDPGLHYNPDAEAVMVDLDEPTNSDDLPELSESVS